MRLTNALLKLSIALLFGLFGPVHAQAYDKTRVVEVAKGVLNQAQGLSFRDGVEYCGYITVDAGGLIAATDPVAGLVRSCAIEDDPMDGSIIASYHTHGSYNPLMDSEIPSSFDIVDDLAHERKGFVSTPGGRFWFIKSARGTAELLCGIGCLLMDDEFDEKESEMIEHWYSIEVLFKRERK